MASGKTLSAGTLNLKFMQNAIRAKQVEAVELPKAAVKDDGEWGVSQEVREAWGLKSSSHSKEANVHEDSYLSFIFEDEDEPGPSAGYKRRRQFGKNGKEVEAKTEEEEKPVEQADDPETAKASRKVHPRPVSISGKSGGFLRGFDQLDSSSKSSKDGSANVNRKTAKEMVFETIPGATSAHRPSLASASSSGKPQATGPTSSAPAQFLKPAGVDEPTTGREKKPKRKREAPGTPDPSRDPSKKVKKQKQGQT